MQIQAQLLLSTFVVLCIQGALASSASKQDAIESDSQLPAQRDGFRPSRNAKPHIVRPTQNAPETGSSGTDRKAHVAPASRAKSSTSFNVGKLPPSSVKSHKGQHADDFIYKGQEFGWWRVSDGGVSGSAWPRAGSKRRYTKT